MRKSLIAVAFVASASLLVAAVPTASASTPAKVDRGLAKATKVVNAAIKAPTSIGVTVPLKSKPPSGKLAIMITSGSPAGVAQSGYFCDAMTRAGWECKIVSGATTPDKIQGIYSSAIDQGADAINMFGIEPSVIGSALVQKARAAGVFTELTYGLEPSPNPMFHVNPGVGGPADYAHQAQAVAAGVVVNTKGKANVQVISLPLYPSLKFKSDQFVKWVKVFCSKCNLAENTFSIPDYGTKIPPNMVSIVQRDPSTNWIVASQGGALTGIYPALASAGYGGGKVNLGAMHADAANIAAIKDGSQALDYGESGAVNAWRAADDIFRYFLKMPFQEGLAQGQLLYSGNINKITIDSKGNYISVPNYQKQFLKLWKLA